MIESVSACCQCGKSFRKYSKGSLAISKYGGVKKNSFIPEYKHLDVCPKCSSQFVKIDWKKSKGKGV